MIVAETDTESSCYYCSSMVVAGPRHSIASSALPSRAFETHHYQTHHHEQQQVTISKGSVGTAQQCVPTAYAFVYGTLKKGFSNYWLMEDVVAKGHARYLGTARTKQKFPMVCGPYQVPFLIDLPSAGYHVRGELYEVCAHPISFFLCLNHHFFARSLSSLGITRVAEGAILSL